MSFTLNCTSNTEHLVHKITSAHAGEKMKKSLVEDDETIDLIKESCLTQIRIVQKIFNISLTICVTSSKSHDAIIIIIQKG